MSGCRAMIPMAETAHKGNDMRKIATVSISIFILLLAGLYGYVWVNKVPDKTVVELSSRWAQPPSQFIPVGGLNVHFRDEGPQNDHLPIVLLHGTSASLHTWDGWTKELKRTHRVIRFDLPAFGLTGPSPINDYSIESYVGFVIAVLNELGVEQFVLGGNSLGGYIAWATAVIHPARVSNLILVDASGYPSSADSAPLAFTIAQTPVINTLLQGFMPRSLIETSVKNVFGNPALVTDELVDRYLELNSRAGNRQALVERFKQTQPGNMATRVKEISADTLIMWGAKDKLIPAIPSAERFNREIKNSTLVIFDELGHVPHEENPELTVARVKEFLSRVKTP